MWIWRISTFTPDLAVTWEFCPVTFLFVHQSACFMNVLQWTVFVSLLEKKKTAQGSQNPSKRLVQLNQYVINPPWVWPACIPKCLKVEGIKSLYQMMAKDHVTVFSSFCSDVFSHYLSSSEICVSVFFYEVTGWSFAPVWIYRTLLKHLDVMQSYRFYHSPLANTTSKPVIKGPSQAHCWV